MDRKGKKSYWDMQRSFWRTPPGIALWILLMAASLGGGLLALNIVVSPYPVIEFFDAEPVVIAPGGSALLSWSVIGAGSVEIRPGVGSVEPSGRREVSPSATTTYTLMALNGSRNRSREIKVFVEGGARS